MKCSCCFKHVVYHSYTGLSIYLTDATCYCSAEIHFLLLDLFAWAAAADDLTLLLQLCCYSLSFDQLRQLIYLTWLVG